MKSFFVLVGLLFSSALFAGGNSSSTFISNEENIRNTVIGNVTAVVLEDFVNNSKTPAKILAVEGFGDDQYALVERDGIMALLLPEHLYQSTQGTAIFVMFVNSCQSLCSGSAIGGAITGAVGGAVGGAQAGGVIAGPHGAGGGLVIGGIIGGVGGGISGYEMCKLATGCYKKTDDSSEKQ